MNTTTNEAQIKTLRVTRKAGGSLLKALGFKEVVKINSKKMALRLSKMALYLESFDGELPERDQKLADACLTAHEIVVHKPKETVTITGKETMKRTTKKTAKKASKKTSTKKKAREDAVDEKPARKRKARPAKDAGEPVAKKTRKAKAPATKSKHKEPRPNSELGIILKVLRKKPSTKQLLFTTLRKAFPEKTEDLQKRNLAWYLSSGCERRGFPIQKDEKGKISLVAK